MLSHIFESDPGLSLLKDLVFGLLTVFIVMEILFTAIRYKDNRKRENRANRYE
jgi:hypothetical protein